MQFMCSHIVTSNLNIYIFLCVFLLFMQEFFCSFHRICLTSTNYQNNTLLIRGIIMILCIIFSPLQLSYVGQFYKLK